MVAVVVHDVELTLCSISGLLGDGGIALPVNEII